MPSFSQAFTRMGRSVTRVAAVAAVTASIGLASTVPAYATINVLETGSSLLYPLFNLWVPAYTRKEPGVRITTASTGSGTGIAQSVAGVAQIGASDAYLSDAMVRKHPNMLSIPLAISSQMVNYNVPGLNGRHLKLSGPVLAGIYSGRITRWDDPAIRNINRGVRLPHHRIVPVHRSDGSGDTFIFTQYLSDSTPSWKQKVGYGTSVSWPPVRSGIGAIGNPGMVQALQTTPYSVAYVGISYKKQIEQAHLGEARLENRAGRFVLPTVRTVKAAAAKMVPQTPPDQRISLIFAPGSRSYPIINYEYAIVSKRQADPEMGKAVKDLLLWAISPRGGNAEHFMKQVHFVPLPASVARLSRRQIEQIR